MSTEPKALGFVATTAECARQTLGALANRRFLTLVVIGAVALGALAHLFGGRVAERLSGRAFYCLVAWWLYGTTLVPFAAIHVGIEAVHGPLEDRTAVYGFLRPVSRGALLLGKWLASAVVASAAACFGVISLFFGVATRGELWPDGIETALAYAFLETMVWAACSYAAVAVLFAARFRRPMLWAAGFVVGIQMLAANLPVSAGLRRLTLTDPLRRLLLDRIEPDDRMARMLWPAERTFDLEALGSPRTDIAILAAVCVLLAMWCYARTEYDSRTRD